MNKEKTTRGDFKSVLRTLRRRLPIIVLAPVIALGAAYAFSKIEHKTYTGTAVLLFSPLHLDLQVTGLPLQTQAPDPTSQAATNVGLVSLPQVLVLAGKKLGPPYTTMDYLKKKVSIKQSGKSELVDVKGSASTPTEAAAIANAMATSFITYRRATTVASINFGIANILRDLKAKNLSRLQIAALENSLTKLTELRGVQTGDVQLAGLALPPTKPSSPNTTLNLAIGGIVGLLVGVAAALIAEALDVKVRRPEDIGDAVDLPILATVPRSKVLKDGLTGNLSASDLEAFRTLRTNLRYRAGGRDIRSVLITSATPGSGKTTVAVNLAAAVAAATPDRVLVIEADMRRPHLAELMGVNADRGLSTALQSGEELEDVVVSVPSAQWIGSNGAGPDGSATGGFDVLPAGPATPNASELLSSTAMSALLRAATNQYALTIVEGPPPSLVSDAIPLTKQVDRVLLVAHLGREQSPELRNLRTQLEELGVRPLGVVANFGPRTSNPYLASSRR
ncbi:MAG TPA: hypothetical protein VKR21_19325 [Solirubrobacteraceae bacterium]|nr:hypothetical protein [Solirubrobacteraceae bacterium]